MTPVEEEKTRFLGIDRWLETAVVIESDESGFGTPRIEDGS